MFLRLPALWYYRMVQEVEEIIATIRGVMEAVPHISFTYLFGSSVSGRLRNDSDIDVAIFADAGGAIEIESGRIVKGEVDIQIAIERATGRNVDLLVMNRAPATVCASALLTGRAVTIRDTALFTRFFLAVTSVAIDFLQTEREFREIRSRSRSISEIDRSRLLRVLDFIEEEVVDRDQFLEVELERYRGDRNVRRNFDRWVETLINAAIDVGKVVLASEHRSVPQTYGQILSELEALPAFSPLNGRLRSLAALRNVMAHEYLDLRWKPIRTFVRSDVEAIIDLSAYTRTWLEGDATPSRERR